MIDIWLIYKELGPCRHWYPEMVHFPVWGPKVVTYVYTRICMYAGMLLNQTLLPMCSSKNIFDVNQGSLDSKWWSSHTISYHHIVCLDLSWPGQPRRVKWDETTIFTTLAPGGGQPVRSCWSVMQVRECLRLVWASGRVLEIPIVPQLIHGHFMFSEG